MKYKVKEEAEEYKISIVEGIVLAIVDYDDDNVDSYIKYDASRFLLTITTI